MKKILYAGAEVMPFAATGGLGDVLGSLPAAVSRECGDADVRVIMPLYKAVKDTWRDKMTHEGVIYVDLSWRRQYCGIKSLVKDGVTFYFIENEYYFNRDRLYGYHDDGERFAFFSKAILELMEAVDFYPRVYNANDWQTAASIVYLEKVYKKRSAYENIKSVFTIHNIEYQGRFGKEMMSDVLGLEDWALLDRDGCVNLMKGAIEYADRVSTVSPTYAREILEEATSHTLCQCLRANEKKLMGILNGIDHEYYDPATDREIGRNYSALDTEGKSYNKKDLQRELSLPERDAPMISVVSRLASHKGLDLVRDMIEELLSEGELQFVLLGSGDEALERFFRDLQDRFPEKCRALITYDRDLAKRVYAASDIFLMPSRSEPCGLSQMIACRYGAIPVVRRTGGLYDSIKDYRECEDGRLLGNGFTFAECDSRALYEAVITALRLYGREDKRRAFVSRIMSEDFSWSASAKKYLRMYYN